MPPSWAQTGVPGFVAFTHFHSSTTSGSACLMIPRTLLSVSPRQSPSSLIRSSIRSEALVSLSAIRGSYEQRALLLRLPEQRPRGLLEDPAPGGRAFLLVLEV